MKMLLLSCCAPCSCAVIQKLHDENVDFSVLFYNPNIFPLAEYEKRKNEQINYCQNVGVPVIELPYNHQDWLKAVQGLEQEPERGKRCSVCFYFRLKRTMEYAKENGFDTVSSVLGISRYKNLDQVNEAAKKAEKETGVVYDYTNWRKGGTEQMRQQIIKQTQMYSQNYCGCPFSKKNEKK